MSWGAHDAASREATLETIVLLLGSLATAKVSDARLAGIGPRERQQGTFDSLRAFLIGESRRQPVVLVLDDLQWMDDTSGALLGHLVGAVDAHRLLVIACHRPEYRPPWAHHSAVIPLALRPLSEAERGALMAGALGPPPLDAELARLLSERSGGNPLVLEELVKALREQGAIVRRGETWHLAGTDAHRVIPDTIHDVIMARIDQLDERLKRVLQVAAVIGRDFAFDVLRAVAGAGEELRASLTRLAELELIREKTIFPVWEFSFKSALVQEVAYRSLLAGRRQELHEQVARILEDAPSDRLEDSYELLAHHLRRSADDRRAAHYLALAGEKAERHFAVSDARRYFEQAADRLAALPDAEAATRAARLRARLGHLAGAQDAPSA